MSEQKKPAAAGKPAGPGYKRSWRNLLINKRYQLRFTLFMVGLSVLLMKGLGFWVMRVANETTEVSKTSVQGTPCPKIPAIEVPDQLPAPQVPMKLPDKEPEPAPVPEPEPEPAPEGAGSGSAGEEEERPRVKVQIDESSMEIVPAVATVPEDLGQKIVAHWTCELKLAAKLDALERGRMRILWVLIGTGLLLTLGLAAYGIKMTHKVAGPLFKVGLYLGKMRGGRYDKVYNLRKGDQLVEFYEHFKHGHAGIVQMQKDDISKVKAVIAAAEANGLGDHATVNELRDMVAKKEKALE
jgi:hypothetical protein